MATPKPQVVKKSLHVRLLSERAVKLWYDHQDWLHCQGCPLCKSRYKVVLARGSLPADILFIGEAPGESENISGMPFDPGAPAGSEFEAMFKDAVAEVADGQAMLYDQSGHFTVRGVSFTFCITNTVACFPQKSSQGDFREPTKEEAAACQQRLLEVMGICQPKLIVCLGAVAIRYLPEWTEQRKLSISGMYRLKGDPSVIKLDHPSRILRSKPNDQEIMRKRFVLHLSRALRELWQTTKGIDH